MFKTSKLAVSVALGLGLVCSVSAAQAGQWLDDATVVAREASEGPRGGDNERPGDKHKRGAKQFEEGLQIAREAGEVRGEGKGHKRFQDSTVIAREASEGPRGGDNERPGDKRRRGGRLFEQSTPIA